MSDYMPVVAAHFGVDPGRVLVCRVEGDELIVVVDRGILGCPKSRIPISKLAPAKPAPARRKPPVVQGGKAVKP